MLEIGTSLSRERKISANMHQSVTKPLPTISRFYLDTETEDAKNTGRYPMKEYMSRVNTKRFNSRKVKPDG